ncbi:conserved hypothetical protein [Sphingobium sp. SYK-6]|uniref:DUF2254 domain-containing protein n=1 Tax=Sphingobium sp. (strain NBRC 103272 / SYK-6) TaxID=627192 RepID=UPI000227706B|nr:DUF2254 domain-containing protein [Sphingobium sp. SYK-6]BAK66324.1 conserved hypothetical protein [Sphingobium sp. SYK-6]
MARLRAFWFSLNASYWFFPALFSVLAVLTAIFTIALDHAGGSDWMARTGWIVPARPEGASNILTVIAGSMIGVASTVFSITIAAVAYASGNYGPRLLTNFMEDKGNQLALGSFISTFVYAVLVLRAVRMPGEGADAHGFVPQISLFVATLLMALSVAVLVYFLHHIPASIRINTVLERVGKRLIAQIEDRFPKDGQDDEPAAPAGGAPVPARATGYVTLIDFDRLQSFACDHDLILALSLRTGDFVHPDVPLLRVHGALPDDGAETLRGAFMFGALRTPEQDPDFLIDELAEIALRALSPGINDPFTAVTALHWLAAATASLARRNLGVSALLPSDGRRRVHPWPDDFAHYLGRGFGAVRLAAAGSPIAACKFLECLASVAHGCRGPRRRAMLAREAEQLMEQARLALDGPALAQVEAAFAATRETFDRP